MLDTQKLLDQFLGSGAGRRDNLKGIAGGALAGGLAGVLLGSKKGRKLAGKAVTYGGLAALGGLAYKVWRDHQQAAAGGAPAQSAPAVPVQEAQSAGFLPPPEDRAGRDALGLTLLRAMIAAAKADGHIDRSEQERVFARMDELDLGVEEKAFIMDELRKPLDIDSVVAGASSPQVALEIYAVSLLAIDPDDAAEQAYLAMLASRLRIDPALAASLQAEVEAQRAAPVA